MLIAIAILGVLRSAVKQVGARLMDAVDPSLAARVREVAGATPGVMGVRSVRVRWIGHTLHTEADVTVAVDLAALAAHDIAHDVQHRLIAQVPRLTSAAVHVSPSGAHGVAAG